MARPMLTEALHLGRSHDYWYASYMTFKDENLPIYGYLLNIHSYLAQAVDEVRTFVLICSP